MHYAVGWTRPYPGLSHWHRAQRGTVQDPYGLWMTLRAVDSTHYCSELSRRRHARRATARDPNRPWMMPRAEEWTRSCFGLSRRRRARPVVVRDQHFPYRIPTTLMMPYVAELTHPCPV